MQVQPYDSGTGFGRNSGTSAGGFGGPLTQSKVGYR